MDLEISRKISKERKTVGRETENKGKTPGNQCLMGRWRVLKLRKQLRGDEKFKVEWFSQ